MDAQDGVYNRRPWDYSGPFGSTQEMLVSQALSTITIPGAILSTAVRPPLPQIQLFPPRFGYRSRQIGINDVINVDEVFQGPPMRTNGVLPGAQGTERNAQGSGSW